MFDWFKKPEYSNVVKFPEPVKVPEMPEVTPPRNGLDSSDAHYYLGTNKSGNISLKVGYSVLTMTPDGVVELIERLSLMIDKHVEVTVKYIEDEQE
jgi:hypothetical protein